jgi:hypothetical protein
VVTAGPTISAAGIRRLLPAAEPVPPIAFGHAAGYRLRAGDRLLVIDGLFLQQPAVRHKELLALLDAGIQVAGCSSMGALRAAELAPFGMHGFGDIFHAYRDGEIQADDEVALVHGEAEDGYPVIVDALVNLRATVTAAAQTGLLSTEQAERVIAAARGLPFTHRSWQHLLPGAGIAPVRVDALAEQLRRARVDAKHRDAVTALTQLRHTPPPGRPGRARPPATLWTERWAETARRSSRAPVTDSQVVHFLRLFSADHWMTVPALEQIAAWHSDLLGGDPARPVRERADRAIATLTSTTDRLSALGQVAHAHMLRRGLIGAAGWPEQVLAHYLDADELAAAATDPVLASMLLAPRVLHRQPLLPEIRHATDLIRADPRFHTWASHTHRWLMAAELLAGQHPELDFSRPDPDVLAELFTGLWNTTNLRAELGRRGFASLDAFHAAAAPFAAAAATRPWPGIQVGWLGPAGSAATGNLPNRPAPATAEVARAGGKETG